MFLGNFPPTIKYCWWMSPSVGCTHLVGRYRCQQKVSYLDTTNRLYRGTVIVEDVEPGLEVAAEDYVLARISTYPDSHQLLTVGIEKVLGDHTKAGLERELVVHAFNLPDAFSRETEEFAQSLQRRGVDVGQDREDWRGLPFITIDGDDARDFDDAVFVEKLAHGWRVCVAIADVSHYVTEGSVLDEEAAHRATSVYLPGSVIPMLPEALSATISVHCDHTKIDWFLGFVCI